MFKKYKVSSWFVLVALVAFEFMSYSSTKTGVESIVGVVSWATLLAFAFVAVDFAGAGILFFSPETLKDSYWSLFAGWALTVIGDVGAAFYNIAASMSADAQTHILVVNGVVSVKMFTIYIPLMITLAWAGIQMSLVHSLNIVVMELTGSRMKGGKVSDERRREQPMQNQKKKDKTRSYPVIDFHNNQGR